MAATLEARGVEPSITVYAILRNSAGNYFDPADNTFKAFVSAATHDLVMTALVSESQVYQYAVTTTNFPASAGVFPWMAYKQVGGAPNLTNDLPVFTATIDWDGDEEADVAQIQEILEDGTFAVNVAQISGDATAADNAEAFFDGTGYAGTNNVIPSVTTVTGNVNGTVASVTGNVAGNVTGSIGSLAAQAKLDVNAEADAALVDVNLDHLVGTAVGIPALPADTFLDAMMDDGVAAYDRTTDSLQAIRDKETDIETDTADIQSRLPAALVGGRMDSSVGAMAAAVVTAAAIATDAIDADSLASDAVAEIADGVWDEAVSGHVTSGTFGQAANIIRAGTAQGGGATSITLDAGASASDNFYNNGILFVTGGTGAGQSRIISDYDGASKAATVSAWVTNPDATSVFVILPFGAIPGATAPTAAEVADAVWDEDATGHQTQGSFGQAIGDPVADADTIWGLVNTNLNTTLSSRSSHSAADVWAVGARTITGGTIDTNNDKTGYRLASEIRNGTAQAGAAGTITLDAGASATNDLYNGGWIILTGGTGAGQPRLVTDYDGATKVATIQPNWAVTPDGTSVFTILPAAYVAGIAGVKTNLDALNDVSTAQVNTEADTALADARLDELLAADSDIDGAAPPTVGSVFHELMSKTAGAFTFNQTTDSNEAIADGVGATAPTAAEVADAVWDEDIVAAHGTADTAGRALRTLDAVSDRTNNANVNALLGVPDSAGADVPSQVTDENWDEATADHVSAGSMGKAVTDILANTAAAAIAAAVWNALRASYKVDGSFGREAGPHYRIHDYTYASNGAPTGYQITYYDTAAHATAGGATGQLFTQTMSGPTWSNGVPASDTISATA